MNLSITPPPPPWSGLLSRLLIWALIVVAACFSLLLLLLRYWLLPDIEQYRENIASAISHASGQHITIGEISANWDGFRPHMMLRAVKVHDKEGDITLLLNQLSGTLSWRSILHGKLYFREIEIEQPDLIVRRDAKGVIHVAGFALSKELTGSENDFSDWLLNQSRVRINNASILWQDDQRGAPELELLVNLRLENRGHRHRFGIRATPPAELAAQLDMRGDFTGESLANSDLWQGRLFMQMDNADIAAWGVWLPFPQEIRLNRGVGALRMWAGIDGANMKKLTADMRLRNVRAQLAPDLPEFDLIRLQGRVGWQKINGGGTEIFAQKLSTSARGKRRWILQPVSFSLQTIPANVTEPHRTKLSIDNLNLEVLKDAAKYLPISASLRERLNKMAPRGEIRHMRANWSGELPVPPHFSAKGGFTNLGMRKSGRLPAFKGVSGNIDITERGGTLTLNSQNAAVELPEVFRVPLVLDIITGQASWNVLADKDSVAFKFNNISFSNKNAAGLAYGTYHFTVDGPGRIDLVANLTRADARYLMHYMPMAVNYRDWLDDSIVEAGALDARLHLKGDLSQFPFAHGENGIFRLQAKVSGVTLDRIPGWPRIENMSGNLQFHNSRMEFDASQAYISGTKLSRVNLNIADMAAPDATLRSEMEASGPTQQFFKFATSRTDSSDNGSLVDNINIAGEGRLLLELNIPLDHPEAVNVSGSYRFIDNHIDPGSHLPNLNDINGVVAFTGSGIKAENMTAHFLGGPVVINSTDMPDGSIRLSAVGKVNLSKMSEPPQGSARAAPLWRRHLRGDTDWLATVDIRNKSADVSIESSLVGITSDLPEPFSKAATDTARLRFERRAMDSNSDELSLSYGDLVMAKFERGRDDAGNYRVERGIVSFGSAPAILPRNGISATGEMPSLNLDRWRSLLTQSSNEPGPGFGLTSINFHIGALDFLGSHLKDVTLSADREDGIWYSTITSEQINGGISWDPSGNGKIVARLNRLIIPANSRPPKSAVRAQTQQERDLPALDVTADNFFIGEKQLGQLELIANQEERNWHIEKLHISNSDSSITARGLWHNRATQPVMRANLTVEASDIGLFLARLGHPDRVKRGSGKLEGVLSWSGGPQSVDYPTLSGNFKVSAKRGQFPRFEPGIGRLFGIFDLRSLPRRITLDFHDVFSEGFGFDNISGDVKIGRGVAVTDDLKIEGPAAKVAINGEINLEAETQKLHIIVNPSLGLAAPVVGVASAIANTAMQNPTPSNEYDITGTWTDPTVIKKTGGAHESSEYEQ
ncbi:YhdP family protein [Nitrosospira sp. NRS527]|uniref:YhdP family protein n=1 Tax=Nitrosospira sp. NRS527 TaxID=155925 RepID=UPI001FD192CC|nr:YhdP family protein [Nitrosospira sp. NRS527]